MDGPDIRLTLNSPDNVYYTTQEISGVIWLHLDRPRKIKAIKVKIEGNGKARWLDVFHRHTSSSGSRIMHSNREIYIRQKHSLPGFEPNGVVLPNGEHNFHFTLPVLESLPSSFIGNHGSIKYKLVIYINRSALGYRRQLQVPITINKYQPLSDWARAQPSGVEKQISKPVGLFAARLITLTVALPTNLAVAGEPLIINAIVDNRSGTCVEKLRFALLQNVTYMSDGTPTEYRREQLRITSKETGAINKKSERIFAHELPIPETLPASDVELSRVITLTYELQVKAVLEGLAKSMLLIFPIVLHSRDVQPPSAPLALTSARASVTPSECSVSRNPFERNYAAEVASPAHSTQSASSSCSSTTSESSATTLSPAGAAGYSEEATTSSGSDSPTPQATPQGTTPPPLPLPTAQSATESTLPAPNSIPLHGPVSVYQLPAPAAGYADGVVSETILSRVWSQAPPPFAVVPSAVNSGSIFWQPPNSTVLHRGLLEGPSLADQMRFATPPRSTFFSGQHRLHAENELPPSYDELFGVPSAPLAEALRD